MIISNTSLIQPRIVANVTRRFLYNGNVDMVGMVVIAMSQIQDTITVSIG